MAYEDDIEFVPDGASRRRAERIAAARAPFGTRAEQEEFLAARRKSRVQRAKEILQICRGIDLHGSVGISDLSDGDIAERLADLIWE